MSPTEHHHAGTQTKVPVPEFLCEPESVNGGKMTKPAQIRILTVDGHPLLLEGLATVIRNQPDMVLVGQASNCHDAIRQFRNLQPDVTLMELRLPDSNGIDAMIAIQTQFPDARIIMMTMFEGDAPVQRALKAGARSYFLKTMPPRELVDAIRHVHAGEKRILPEIASRLAEHYSEDALTEREIEVLQQVAGGNRNCDIAGKLFIAVETVKVHIKHIMEKLCAADRTEAVAIGLRRGIIQL